MNAPADSEYLTTLGVVSGGHFLSHLYILVYPPLFPLLVDEFGLSNAELGLIMSAGGFAMLLLQTPAGELVDRIGAKRVFVWGVLLTAAGTTLVGTADSYAALLAFAVVAGVGQSAFHPADYALLDAVTDGEHEGGSFGVHTFAGYAGFAVAPAAVGGVGYAYGWQPALFAVGGFGVLYAVGAQLTMAPVHRRSVAALDRGTGGDDESGLLPGPSALVQPAVLLMFAFFVVVAMADKGIQTFTTIFMVEELSLSSVVGNSALSAYFVLAAIGVLAGGVLADRLDVRWLIVGTLTVAALGTWSLTTGLASTEVATVALFGLVGLFYGSALPARDRLVNALSTAGATGKSFGFVYTGLSLGITVGPVLLGVTIDLVDATVAFLLIGTFFVASAAVIVLMVLWTSESSVPGELRSMRT